ncbi:hypothetical protein EVAR_72976_1 [Eumeta japonica]|uniref:Uncharacterized protein n=1 Tax=Eumeta variegata TaxID=151549 RepID=A0A4C1SPU4_EUMVA|nr:hypothetical protein EVAR_72976_1 [Eumeta japonica]
MNKKNASAVSLELTKRIWLVKCSASIVSCIHKSKSTVSAATKRRLLSELKDELEYCRRKWAAARAKTMKVKSSAMIYDEFARRKLEDANNSLKVVTVIRVVSLR